MVCALGYLACARMKARCNLHEVRRFSCKKEELAEAADLHIIFFSCRMSCLHAFFFVHCLNSEEICQHRLYEIADSVKD